VAVSFIGGGNRSTRRKPPTWRKSLTGNLIPYSKYSSTFTKYLTPFNKVNDRLNVTLQCITSANPGNIINFGLRVWCLTPLSTISFSYIVAVSFIGGGNLLLLLPNT
jgi:hypothetical protein